jgi:hypothetical protein
MYEHDYDGFGKGLLETIEGLPEMGEGERVMSESPKIKIILR